MSLEDCVRQRHPECSYQVRFLNQPSHILGFSYIPIQWKRILLSDQGKSSQGCLWRLESGPFHLAETFKDEVRTQYRGKVFNKWYRLCLNFWKIKYALSFAQREFLVLTGFNATLLLRIFSHLQDACRCKGSQHLAPKVIERWRIFLPEHPYNLHPHIVAWASFIPFLNSGRQVTIFNRLHSDFTVVSVLEQLEVGLEVLECLLPSYFKVGQVAMLTHIVNNLTLLLPCKPSLF